MWISTPLKHFNLTRQKQNTFSSTSCSVQSSTKALGKEKRETNRLLPGGFPTWTPWRRCIRASSSLLQSWSLPYAAMSSGPPSISSLASFRICMFVTSRCFAQNTPVAEQLSTRQPPIVCVSIDLVCMRLGCAAWRCTRVLSKTTEAVRLPSCSVLFCLSTVGYFRSRMPLK